MGHIDAGTAPPTTPENLLVVFPFSRVPKEAIKKTAQSSMFPAVTEKEGANANRIAAYYAGRAALAFGFSYLGLDLRVRPAMGYGYLEVVKPDGTPKPGVYVNVTHTDEIAVAAIASQPVGVDIESIHRPVGKAILRAASQEELENYSDWQIELNRTAVPPALALWCAKEAYTKSLGLGLSVGIDKVTLNWEGGGKFAVSQELVGPMHVNEPSIALQLMDEYLIAICSDGSSDQGFKQLRFGMENF